MDRLSSCIAREPANMSARNLLWQCMPEEVSVGHVLQSELCKVGAGLRSRISRNLQAYKMHEDAYCYTSIRKASQTYRHSRARETRGHVPSKKATE